MHRSGLNNLQTSQKKLKNNQRVGIEVFKNENTKSAQI